MIAPPLSPVQQTALRAIEVSTMLDRADIVTKVRVSDGAGGSTYTETTQSNIPCRRTPGLAGATETQFGGQLVSGIPWTFAFPFGTTISRDDEIVQGAQRFAVIAVLAPRSYETCRLVITNMTGGG